MTELVKEPIVLQGKALEEFVVKGNLSALSPTEKAAHYIALCHSLDLNPATKPFEYIVLNGKETLYARRDCTDQLRFKRNVSIEIVSREQTGDVFQVIARAMLPSGRCDESIGAVSIGGLKGEPLANALMKCETKAKRRVTLSICGLGLLDEMEVADNIGSRFEHLPQEQAPKTNLIAIEPKRVEPKRAESKKHEALPEIPETIGAIPASIMLAHHTLLNGLEGIELSDMAGDDLDLVIDVMRKAYAVDKPAGKVSQRCLDWYRAIAEQAKSVVASRDNPPPPEAE